VGVSGAEKAGWMIFIAKRQKLRIRYVRIAGAMGSKQRTRQEIARPQRVIEIEKFFPAFVDQGFPFPGLAGVYIDAVMGIQIPGCVDF